MSQFEDLISNLVHDKKFSESFHDPATRASTLKAWA